MIKAVQTAVHDGFAERAHRYVMNAPLRFRVRKERKWREGVLQNISTSGLLLKTHQTCALGTSLEMRFVLPDNAYGKGAAELFCSGKVIRVEDPTEPGSEGFMAVAIERSRLVRLTA